MSFTAWTFMVDEKARIKHLMKTYAARIVGRKKRAALLTLHEWTQERVELKRKLRTALARMLNRQIAKAFANWKHNHVFLHGFGRRIFNILFFVFNQS